VGNEGANIYSYGMSEEVTGRARHDFARRDEMVITTKVRFATDKGANNQGLSRKHILSAIDASLKRWEQIIVIQNGSPINDGKTFEF
jgi:aryl-alcohol dehydrogenase-like predicted oxidoreductase